MRRPIVTANDGIDSDSFLDVVANIVGILIILVMVVGLRIKNLPHGEADAPTSTAAATAGVDLSEPLSIAERLQADVLKLAAEIEMVNRTAALQFAERQMVANRVAAQQRELEAKRAELDETRQNDYDLQRELASVRAALEQSRQEEELLKEQPDNTIEIESYPTPLSRTVDGKEGHFQLRGGRVVPIPLDRLLERFRADAEGKLWKLRSSNSFTDMVGPIGGFYLRYTLERVDMTLPTRNGATTGRGSFAELTEWKLLPTAENLGEPLETALAPASEFRAAVAALGSVDTTITLWAYPDSFDLYRQLKKELYRLGYATAGRPLPEGILIGGSPQGSKSAAQ